MSHLFLHVLYLSCSSGQMEFGCWENFGDAPFKPDIYKLFYHLTQPIKSYLQNRPWKINFNDRALDGTDINDINKYKAAKPNLLVFKTKS